MEGRPGKVPGPRTPHLEVSFHFTWCTLTTRPMTHYTSRELVPVVRYQHSAAGLAPLLSHARQSYCLLYIFMYDIASV